jgi:ribonuclease D
MGRKYYSSKKKKNNHKTHHHPSTGTNQSSITKQNDHTNHNESYNNQNNNIVINQQSYQLWFQESTKNDLLQYLNNYRQGCYEYYNNTRMGTTITTASINQSKPKKKKISFTLNDKEYHHYHLDMNDTGCMIGGIQFPSLYDDNDSNIFQQPYLVLPYQLSSKQRKVIHICCLQLDIYHDSVYDILTVVEPSTDNIEPQQPPQRVMVISCYADGFQYLPSHLQPEHEEHHENSNKNSDHKIVDLFNYKPWYCRTKCIPICIGNNYNMVESNDTADLDTCTTPTKSNCYNNIDNNNFDEIDIIIEEKKIIYTKQMKDRIWELIDQPWKCIRTDPPMMDTISYNELYNTSLHDYCQQYNIRTTSWILVDTVYKMEQCIQELNHPNITEIAFDIESCNNNNNNGASATTQITCLIQITTNLRKEYIIDPLAPGVWDLIYQLQSVFSNPNIVKIGHAIHGLDVPSLYRDYGIIIVNVFDTYEAAKCIPKVSPYGLAALCQYYYMDQYDQYMKLKDIYQNCNWRVRPLTKDMIIYARMDIHYLIPLRKLLIRDMVLSYNPTIWRFQSKKNDFPTTNDKEDVVVSDGNNIAYDKNNNTEQDHTTTSNGDDPFLSEVQYNDFVTSSSTSNGKMNITKSRDVLDFISNIVDQEDGNPSTTTATSILDDDDDDDDDDDQTTTSFNTAMQYSIRQTSSSFNGNGSFNYNSDIYNTCTEEEHEDDDGDEGVTNDNKPKDITAAELRLQPIVMQCLGICQERCLNLWSDKKQSENYLKNETYQSIKMKLDKTIHTSSSSSSSSTKSVLNIGNKKKNKQQNGITFKEETPVSISFTQLYLALVEWRNRIATDMECLPGFIVSLDFLAQVAYKRPMTIAGLQLIAYQFPIILQTNETIRNSLFDVVIQQTMVYDQLSIPTATIYYYSNIKNKANDIENYEEQVSKSINDALLVKVFVGGSLCFGFFMSFYDIVQQNPQQFQRISKQVIPLVQTIQQHTLLYMNHFIQQQIPIYMKFIQQHIPSFMKISSQSNK